MRDFKKIQVWQKSHEFTLKIYKLTANFPKDERFGLVSQMRRATASTPTNIAEGAGRDTQKEFARFVHIASGSASEVEYLLLLAHELGYISAEEYPLLEKDILEIKRMLVGFGKALKND
ncbi:MAG: four helix bundle protein [Anaerolineales bacterium]|uniref:Four helix bundle protein n=1 Tax=Candidatus Desulfolinea nitratireducens TaxID=2841698 RepID=A0A8J6NJP8_9CHLR|nr:four helix bundle protein [Candidatus Desulfolinea nitratireducens]